MAHGLVCDGRLKTDVGLKTSVSTTDKMATRYSFEINMQIMSLHLGVAVLRQWPRHYS